MKNKQVAPQKVSTVGGMVAALTFLFPVPSAECSLNE